jgi:hypothetical protein
MVVLEKEGFMFYRRRLFSLRLTLIITIAVSLSGGTFAFAADRTGRDKNARVEAPLNIAILIQDDLISSVGNEIRVTADFIRALPNGSRVMVGYITAGTLQVRQPFTTDLDKAARSLRVPLASTSASPFNPYVEVIEALRQFDGSSKGRNAMLLISDGLDVSRGFDSSAAGRTMDLERAIRQANSRQVAVYSFYAPSVGLTSHNLLAVNYGQSSLNRLSDDTGGRAFFQGTTGFVTFNSYFDRLRAALNAQYARAY